MHTGGQERGQPALLGEGQERHPRGGSLGAFSKDGWWLGVSRRGSAGWEEWFLRAEHSVAAEVRLDRVLLFKHIYEGI